MNNVVIDGITSVTFKRLRWLCSHRSMREIDVLLGAFFDTIFPSLTPELAVAFVALAEMEDHELWALVTGKRECNDSQQVKVLNMLRNAKIK